MAVNTGIIPGYSYANITSATTTVVKTGTGILHVIMVNKAAGSATVTIYDNTSATGTKIGSITMPASLNMDSAAFIYDVAFTTGLTIVTTGTQDLTVSYV